jgi:hypothetical protein
VIPGDPISVDLHTQDVAGVPCIVLKLLIDGVCIACRWETDANQYQVAAALRRLADRLEGKI